jgi:hypothetical protein
MVDGVLPSEPVIGGSLAKYTKGQWDYEGLH